TDERLVGVPLNLNTLTADPNGTLLDMGHIQLALRHYLNISSTLDKKYPLGSTLLTSLLA
ncbi:MAG TPA: hypothetical protein PK011_13025, partial [Marinagarivorans sp.]|nr:hypothetical protein [Marinagarivorans sp.]